MFDVNFLPATGVLPIAESFAAIFSMALAEIPAPSWLDDAAPANRLNNVGDATLILPDDHPLPPPPSK